jgi:hypothetical protein
LHSEVLDGHMHLEAEIPESLARRLEDFAVPGARALRARDERADSVKP